MDRIWQWAWNRYGARYSWALCAIAFVVVLPIYLASLFVVVAFEQSDHYVEAAVRRRPGLSTARTRRQGIPCPEREVSPVQVFGLDHETDARVDLTS
jgi:hypothetical protein